jgi:hypothetical protein
MKNNNISDIESRHKYNLKFYYLYLSNYKLYARYGRIPAYHQFLITYTPWIKIAYLGIRRIPSNTPLVIGI